MSDCRSCKDYRECDGLIEWFHFGQIRWCIYQVIWLIKWAPTLRAGHWPQNPDRTDDSSGQRTIKTEGAFAKPVIIIAELDERLKRTGIQGKLLVAQVEADRTFEELDYEAREALLYVKGFRRKKEGFGAWKKRRNYRQKGYQKVVKAS